MNVSKTDILRFLGFAVAVITVVIVMGVIVSSIGESPKDEPEIYIECQVAKDRSDFICEFTNIGNVVAQECVMVAFDCQIADGQPKKVVSQPLCSGWLMPLKEDPKNAISWHSPEYDFPPRWVHSCGSPYPESHRTITVEEFIEERTNQPLIQWKQ